MTPTSINPASNLFPSANVVYVDNDFRKLRSKGLLAYGTLVDALASWDVGGKARQKFGTPSATNYANILLGAGIIEAGVNEVFLSQNFGCYIDEYDFVNIVGQGKDVTILTSNIASVGAWLTIRVAHVNMSDFTLKSSGIHVGNIIYSVTACSGIFSNLIFNGAGGTVASFIFDITTSMGGLIRDCEFDGSGLSATTTGLLKLADSLDNGLGKVVNCNFNGVSTVTTLMRLGGSASYVLIKGCNFYGPATTSLFDIAVTDFEGRIEDCHFETTSGKCITCAATFAFFLIKDCTLLCADVCFSAVTQNRTRLLDCYMRTTGTNKVCIQLESSSTGVVIYGCRLVSSGTGESINSTSTINAEITNNTLRLPTGDTAGTSISSNITNLSDTPFNAEVPAATTF